MFVLACGSLGLISREMVSSCYIFSPDPFDDYRCSKQISIVPPPICFPQVEHPYKRSLFNFSFRKLQSKFHILPLYPPHKKFHNFQLFPPCVFKRSATVPSFIQHNNHYNSFVHISVPPPRSTRIGSPHNCTRKIHHICPYNFLVPFTHTCSRLHNPRWLPTLPPHQAHPPPNIMDCS